MSRRSVEKRRVVGMAREAKDNWKVGIVRLKKTLKKKVLWSAQDTLGVGGREIGRDKRKNEND